MSVKENFESILEKVEKAAHRSGRKAQEIDLIAVTKNASIQEMQEAYALSFKEFGESRLQKAIVKQKDFPDGVHWHFIGPIQSNKAVTIASHFSLIHSLSSLKIAKLLSDFGERREEKVRVFFQLDLSKEGLRNGFSRNEFIALQEDLISLKGLSLEGLMTMAPHTEDKNAIRMCFRTLFEIKNSFGNRYRSLSMGMSEDFEIAIEEGSTHIRIGSGIFS